jgi:hypothetical protein
MTMQKRRPDQSHRPYESGRSKHWIRKHHAFDRVANVVDGSKPVLTPIRRTDQLQTMLRNLGLTFLLVASAGPASATDPSAMEETNCLMACDANQQNCQATGQVSTERNYSFAQHSPPSKMKSAVVRSRQMIQLPEAREIARVPH